MTDHWHEHELSERFRELAVLDRQLTAWGWYRRHEHHPRSGGWRFAAGMALIRLGRRLQQRGGTQPAGTSGEL